MQSRSLKTPMLLIGVLLGTTQAACWSDAISCGKDTDCFSGELCVQGACTSAKVQNGDQSPDLRVDPDMSPPADMPKPPDMRAMCPANAPTQCGRACVNTTSDSNHCGGCDKACDADLSCINSTCQGPPPNCTEAGCPDGSTCDPDTNQCIQGCRNNNDCPDTFRCNQETRQCSCRSGYQQCGERCVPFNDPNACGLQCQICPSSPLGQASCVQGECTLDCVEGTALCGGACTKCPDGPGVQSTECKDTACVVKSCADGFKVCAEGNGCCQDEPADCSTLVKPNALGRLRGERQWRKFINASLTNTIELDGSQNPLGSVVSGYRWTLIRPPNSNAALTPNATNPQPSLRVDVVGDFAVELRVLDVVGRPSCESDTVKISVAP